MRGIRPEIERTKRGRESEERGVRGKGDRKRETEGKKRTTEGT